jgi:hypothetical protein
METEGTTAGDDCRASAFPRRPISTSRRALFRGGGGDEEDEEREDKEATPCEYMIKER